MTNTAPDRRPFSTANMRRMASPMSSGVASTTVPRRHVGTSRPINSLNAPSPQLLRWREHPATVGGQQRLGDSAIRRVARRASPTMQYETLSSRGAADCLIEEPALTDARFTGHDGDATMSGRGFLDDVAKYAQFVISTDEDWTHPGAHAASVCRGRDVRTVKRSQFGSKPGRQDVTAVASGPAARRCG
jgi:hypothetical protein